MSALWSQLLLVMALVMANAAFAGTEIALVSLRDSQIERLAATRRAGRIVARLAKDPNRFLATIQIGITLAGFLASAVAALTLAEPLIDLFAALGAAARPVAVFVVTLLLTFLTLVAGELTPKRLAMQHPERWALLAARPLATLAAVSRPAVWLLSGATDLTVRLFGGDPSRHRPTVTQQELRDMVALQPELTPGERTLIMGAFEFADRRLREVLIPHSDVVALPADLTVSEAALRLVNRGHQRAPVYRQDLDDVIGTVHLRSLVGAEGIVEEHVQAPLFLPESVSALDALRTMQAQGQQMVIVINEYGGTEGIVTVEDLVEELVGEIWNEDDRDVRTVQRHPDGAVTVVGSFPVHDLPDLGIELPSGRYATVAGLVLDQLTHIPRTGEATVIDGWELRVEDATERAVRRVRISPRQSARSRPR